MVNNKTILITQARLGSTRLPGKVLKEINGKSILQIHLERLNRCQSISEIIVATTINPEDGIIYEKVIAWGFSASRGSESDVLDRFYQAAKDKGIDWIVRVTSDCPLIDPILVDQVVDFVQKSDKDYGSNVIDETFPDGQDVEVFKFSALKKAWNEANKLSEREHVTPYIRNNSDLKFGNLFSAISYKNNTDYSKIRMTVDEQKDFELINKIISDLGTEQGWLDYTEYIIKKDLANINGNIIRNEGYLKSLKND